MISLNQQNQELISNFNQQSSSNLTPMKPRINYYGVDNRGSASLLTPLKEEISKENNNQPIELDKAQK